MRGLGNVLKGAVFLAGLVGVSASVFAQQDPQVQVTVTTINSNVTLSRPASKSSANDSLPTYAAYEIVYKNNTTNTLGRLYFKATLTTLDSAGLAVPVSVTSIGTFQGPNIPDTFSCSGYGSASLDCKSGITLQPGGQAGDSYRVIVVAQTPQSGYELRIDVSAGGYEGKGQGNGCCSQVAPAATTRLIDSTIDITYRSNAQSFVRGSGGTLFTGDRWITISGSDDYTTKVSIPKFTSVEYVPDGKIVESPLSDAAATNCITGGRFTTCYQSEISLPNVSYPSAPPVAEACIAGNEEKTLAITVRIDSSLFKSKSLKIDDVRLYYNDPTASPPKVNFAVVYCNVASDYPCVCEKKQYTNKSVSGWTRQLDNDFELLLRNNKNGVFAFD